MRELDTGSVAVVAAGTPVTVIDDVITDTRQSLSADSALVLPENGPGEWEPTPLPGPMPPKPETASTRRVESGEEWEPTRLPRSQKPDRILAAPLDSVEIAAAVELAGEGGSIQIQHPLIDELRLSHLAGIPEAVRAGGGRLVIELQPDG